MAHKSKVSPALFVVTILCFLFPFVTVSCNGQKVASLSGMQLATGTSVEQQQVFGPPRKEKVTAEPLATVALVCALAGLGLSFLGVRAAIAPAGAGALGALLLVILQSKLNSDITDKGQGMFKVEFEAGYVLVIVFFIAAAAWNAYLFFSGRNAVALAASPPMSTGAAATAGVTTAAFCPHCGQKLAAESRFCGACGKSVG